MAEPDPSAQAAVVAEFVEGLLEAFGLEGEVTKRVDDGVIYVDVTGEQTEALVGPKGAIMNAILELCRTVVQRKTFASARLRLDIAGYGARRREALQIYAARLAEQVLDDGEEVMLEPMHPADRKVVHDAIAEIEGVRTYSEGEEPNRSVVLSLAPGQEPRGAGAAAAGAGEPGSGDGEPAAAEPEPSGSPESDDSPESGDSPESDDSSESDDSPDSPDENGDDDGSDEADDSEE